MPKLYCTKCARFLGEIDGTARVMDLICAKCKKRNNFIIKTPTGAPK